MITTVSPDIPIRNESIIFGGLNRNINIEDEEWTYLKNIDTENVPFLSPRKPMEKIREFKKCNGYLVDENKECWVDGTELFYDGKKVGTVEDSPKNMVEFNRNIVIFPDKIAYNIEKKEMTEKFKAPDLEHIVVKDNRIWGTKGVTIYGCKLGDYTEWDKPTDVLDGVYYVDVAGGSGFKGISVYADKLVLFKSSSMYELYGKTPKDFELFEAYKIGCVDENSISEVSGTLYFTSQSGIYAYGGGIPRPMSYKLNEEYVNSTGISDNRKYYISVDNGKTKQTYMYDTFMNCWTSYCDKFFNYWGYLEKERVRKIRAVSDNTLYEFESGDEQVEWEAISKKYDDRTFQKKAVKRIKIRANMTLNSLLEVYISRDGKPFELQKVIRKTNEDLSSNTEFTIPISLNRCKEYQIKLKGKGFVSINGEKEIVYRSDK